MYAALNLSSSSSLVDVNSPRPMPSGFEVKLPTVLKQYKAGKEEEENENVVRFSFLLGKHRDRHLDIVGNEISLLSKRHPLLYVIFTLKRWARLIG